MRSMISKDADKYGTKSMISKHSKHTFREYLIPVDTIDNTTSINTSRRKNNQINPNIISAISDQAYSYKETNILRFIINFYQNRNIIIRPNHYGILLWDFLIVIIVIYYLLEIGMIIGFQQDFWQDELNTVLGLQIFFIVVLAIDMLISPLKAYYQEGLLITNVQQIISKYMKCQFWIDISGIIMIMVPLISQNIYVNVIKIFWFAKIYTTSRINQEYQRITQLNIMESTLYLVLKLIVYCYFYAHYMGIGFYLTSLWVFNNNYYGPRTPNICWIYNAWAFSQLQIILTWPAKYAYIMYYSIAVVTTIAYGDITPLNPIQVIYTIFALIIVTIIFGYIMTEILRLLINIFSYNFDRRFQQFSFIQMLRTQMVKQTIQQQIRAQSQYLDREQRYRKRDIQDNLLSFLPDDPLYRLLLVLYKDFLYQLGLSFINKPQYSNFGIKGQKCLFLEPFIKDIRQRRQFIGDILYNQNETEDLHHAYFYTKTIYENAVLIGFGNTPVLKMGKLDLAHNIMNSSYEIKRISKIFGHIEFFTGKNRSHWAICLQNCVLFVASRSSLLKYYSLLTNQQRQIVFAQMQSIQSAQCLICSENHNHLRCPFVFYKYDYQYTDTKVQRLQNTIIKKHTKRYNRQNAYKTFNKIKDYKAIISKQYKQKLMVDKAAHQLFVELQLDEEEYYQQDNFEEQLLQTQIMVEKIYNNSLEEIGILPFQYECDQVRNYQYYKPQGNSDMIQSQYEKLPRKYMKSSQKISNMSKKSNNNYKQSSIT